MSTLALSVLALCLFSVVILIPPRCLFLFAFHQGMPMLAPSFIEPGTVIHMQSENGVIGVGP